MSDGIKAWAEEQEAEAGEREHRRKMAIQPQAHLNEVLAATNQLFLAKEKVAEAKANVRHWEEKLKEAYEAYIWRKKQERKK